MYYKIFDVARWSTADIQGIMDGQGIELEGQANIDFIEAVIADLEKHFDAEYGINWGVIEDAVHDVAIERKVEKNEEV
jgi:hypothetical protein